MTFLTSDPTRNPPTDGTTAALDEAIKSKYDKASALVEKNLAAIREAFKYTNFN